MLWRESGNENQYFASEREGIIHVTSFWPKLSEFIKTKLTTLFAFELLNGSDLAVVRQCLPTWCGVCPYTMGNHEAHSSAGLFTKNLRTNTTQLKELNP